MQIQTVLHRLAFCLPIAIWFALGASDVRSANLEVPSQFPSIQGAFDSAPTGDTVLLSGSGGRVAESADGAAAPVLSVMNQGL